ncbi:MAG: hypothetical protein GY906_10865 [bacterium]|nr:hypothetical protein [bacterium]
MQDDSTIDQSNDSEEIRIGTEDLVDTQAFVITEEDLVEGDMRALFETPVMRQFIEFVEAGLPDAFLRSNPDLARAESRKKIEKVVVRVPDQALRQYLENRLQAISNYSNALDIPE